MKKLAVLLLALLLIAAVCTGCSSRDKAGDSAPAATVKPDPPLEELLAAVRSAENAGEAIRVVTQTGSADDRLALMNEIADVFAEELETGGWDFRMDQISFASGLWPIPDTGTPSRRKTRPSFSAAAGSSRCTTGRAPCGF